MLDGTVFVADVCSKANRAGGKLLSRLRVVDRQGEHWMADKKVRVPEFDEALRILSEKVT